MIEARIECLCAEFKINDLGLDLVRGQVKWVSEVRAKASAELRHARQIKAVSVRYEKRGETVDPSRRVQWIHGKGRRKPPVQRPTRAAVAPPPAPPPPAPPAPPKMSEDDVRRITREEMHKALSSGGASLSKADVAEVLREVLGAIPVAPVAPVAISSPPRAKSGAEVVEADEPVFVPSDLGRNTGTAEITVEAAEAKSDTFEEAAKAMRESVSERPKRTRKPRK